MSIKKNIILIFLLLVGVSFHKVRAQTPPTLTAIGNQIYCPLSQINIAINFNIIPGDDEIDAVFIQISENYDSNEDLLLLTNLSSHPTITASWNKAEGKLTLQGITSSAITYLELIAAVKDVVFQSSSPSITG